MHYSCSSVPSAPRDLFSLFFFIIIYHAVMAGPEPISIIIFCPITW